MAVIDSGNNSAGKANVDAAFNLNVALPSNPEYVGQAIAVSSIDDGSVTGNFETRTIDVDEDFKLRVGQQTLLECETFNYVAQNTGKYSYSNTTMTVTWSASGMTTNGSAITTTTTGVAVRSRAHFPIFGQQTTFCEIEASFSQQPTTNTEIDFGLFTPGGANPFAPVDGAFFRLNSSGIVAVCNYGGVEVTSSPVDFTGIDGSASYTNTKKYQFIVQIADHRATFWINGLLAAAIDVPVAQGSVVLSSALPFAVRHAIVGGAAGVALQCNITKVSCSINGHSNSDTNSTVGNRTLGSYQGLGGGTMGSLASYANNTNPAGTAGSNTAANVTGLGGQGAINAAAAAATDFIMCSYQVPAGSTLVQGRRLAIRGVFISLCNLGADVATTPTTLALSLAFGHTAVSMATTEAATTKAPRRIPLGFSYFPVAAPIGATPQDGPINIRFDNPIYVNPGEFIATVMKFVAGTATASQVINYHVTFDYGWE